MWLRPGTPDVAVFERMFLRSALDVSAYPQQERIAARAHELGRRAVIIDGGANIGFAAIWFARLYPEATILAVEPGSENFALLKKNAAAYSNIVPIHAGLWDKPTDLGIVNMGAAAWALRVGEVSGAPAAETIEAVAINELIARAGHGAEPLIVKLIIEGAERAVFRSNTEWLDRTDLVIYMPGDWAQPWGGAGRTAMAALARQPFDWIVRELCVFCFREPTTAGTPHTGARSPRATVST
jgi:FkbM family methyltransferase